VCTSWTAEKRLPMAATSAYLSAASAPKESKQECEPARDQANSSTTRRLRALFFSIFGHA
jgi:hypothetical protein